ncbi:unnamed protein product [Leptidea sinapis]|uniref:Uncharacterized protein n=1 Tax=Leptidea sinapis TaxID=189913 RepID=A0A5E4PRS5_9NEOP|nr:unnamed protein product [Leptidea sinapis]
MKTGTPMTAGTLSKDGIYKSSHCQSTKQRLQNICTTACFVIFSRNIATAQLASTSAKNPNRRNRRKPAVRQ